MARRQQRGCTCMVRPDPQCRAHEGREQIEPEYLRWSEDDDAAFHEAWLTMHDSDAEPTGTWKRVSDWLWGEADEPQEPWGHALAQALGYGALLVLIVAICVVLMP